MSFGPLSRLAVLCTVLVASRYVDFLCGLRDPGNLVIGGLAGPFTPDELMPDSLGSICSADYTPAFGAYARLLAQHTTDATLTD